MIMMDIMMTIYVKINLRQNGKTNGKTKRYDKMAQQKFTVSKYLFIIVIV